MLEFLWSGSSKPPRSDERLAQEGLAPPTAEGPLQEESTSSPPCDPGESVVEAALLQAAPTTAEQAGPPAADGCDLPTAFGLARRTGRQRGRRLVKPAPILSPLQNLAMLPIIAVSGLLQLAQWMQAYQSRFQGGDPCPKSPPSSSPPAPTGPTDSSPTLDSADLTKARPVAEALPAAAGNAGQPHRSQCPESGSPWRDRHLWR